MSSEDDWGKWIWAQHFSAIFVHKLTEFWIENQLDSDNEEKEEKKKAASKFDDEDQVDPEEVARKKKEEIRKAE